MAQITAGLYGAHSELQRAKPSLPTTTLAATSITRSEPDRWSLRVMRADVAVPDLQFGDRRGSPLRHP